MGGVSQEEYRAGAEEMIAHYRAAEPISTKQRLYRAVLIGHGWCAEVHRLAELSLDLMDRGFQHEAQILLRTMFETTVSLHWLSQKGDAAAEGILAEGDRQNRAAAQDMQKAFSVPQELIDRVLAEPVTKTDESELFKRFQAQCDELDPSRQLYSVYRHLCGFAHPSSLGAFAFVQESTTPPSLLSTPKTDAVTIPATAAMCTLWSGRAFDEMVVGKPRKQFLRSMARRLHLPAILPALR